MGVCAAYTGMNSCIPSPAIARKTKQKRAIKRVFIEKCKVQNNFPIDSY
jgi:hypothetical protein